MARSRANWAVTVIFVSMVPLRTPGSSPPTAYHPTGLRHCATGARENCSAVPRFAKIRAPHISDTAAVQLVLTQPVDTTLDANLVSPGDKATTAPLRHLAWRRALKRRGDYAPIRRKLHRPPPTPPPPHPTPPHALCRMAV